MPPPEDELTPEIAVVVVAYNNAPVIEGLLTSLPAAMTGGEHTAGRTPYQRRHCLHGQGERARTTLDGEHVDIGQVEERARGRADSMRHVEAFMDQVAWSLPILEASTSTQASQHALRNVPTHPSTHAHL